MATDYKFRITAQDKTKTAFNSVNKSVNSTQVAMKKLAASFAGVFAVRQLVQFTNESMRLADEVGKTADKLGLTTDFLQRMQFAAEQTGIATNTLNMGLQRFTRRVAEARNGTGEAKAALEQLGIALNDSEGNARSIEDVLADVSDGLANTADSGEKVRLAFKFFDSEGVSLVSTLGEGSEALDSLMQSATGVIPEETIRQAERFNDTMLRLKREILTPLQGKIIDVANSFLDFLDAMGLISAETKTLTLLTYDLEKAQIRLQKIQEQLDQGSLGQGARAAKQRKANLQAEIDELNKLIAAKKKEQEEEDNRRKKYTATFTEIKDASTNIAKTVTDNITVVKQFTDTIEGQLTNAFTDFFDFANKEFLDFKNLATNVARAVINELIQIFIVKKLVGMVQGSITAFTDSFSTGETTGISAAESAYNSLNAVSGATQSISGASPTVNFNISTVDASGFDQLLTSRKGLITQIVNNAMNNQGKMGIV